jgi:hypothetical protein
MKLRYKMINEELPTINKEELPDCHTESSMEWSKSKVVMQCTDRQCNARDQCKFYLIAVNCPRKETKKAK